MYTFTEPSEVKLIILYIIQNFAEPIDNGQITDIFMDYAFVDYFSMQQYLDELVEMHLVDIDRADKVRLYFLTEHGKEAYEAYIHKIPTSVREKLLKTIRTYKKRERNAADISASFRPLNELSYLAELSIRDSGFPLMEVRLSVGSKETARAVCQAFKENPDKVYTALLGAVLPDETEKE